MMFEGSVVTLEAHFFKCITRIIGFLNPPSLLLVKHYKKQPKVNQNIQTSYFITFNFSENLIGGCIYKRLSNII